MTCDDSIKQASIFTTSQYFHVHHLFFFWKHFFVITHFISAEDEGEAHTAFKVLVLVGSLF